MKQYNYEIYLGQSALTKEDWQNFLLRISHFLHKMVHFRILVRLDHCTLHYYLSSNKPLASVGAKIFCLKPLEQSTELRCFSAKGIYFNSWQDNLLDLVLKLRQNKQSFVQLELNLHANRSGNFFETAKVTYYEKQKIYTKRIALCSAQILLAIDYSAYENFSHKKIPKYLSTKKVLKLFSDDQANAIMEADTFPFTGEANGLALSQYDFAKHSLILGASGSGKSRFISLLVERLSHMKSDYKVIIIDPHDTLFREVASVEPQIVINFASAAQSIDLFKSKVRELGVTIELLLSLFESLIDTSYNQRLERVLRFSIHLLLLNKDFSFQSLRQLILDAEFRNALLRSNKAKIPANVTEFFLTDFNLLKSQSYDQAIAPIIAFLDEMQIVPVFSMAEKLASFSDTLQKNFLTVFSLSQLRLGNKITCAVAGMIFQQLFLLAQQRSIKEQLIVIIDEVSVIEHPLLVRFLSELRKFGVTIILAGQFLEQMTPALRSAIFANVSNFYLFRTSYQDARILIQNLDFPLEGSNLDEDKCKMLSSLKTQECVARISAENKLYPAFKATVVDFEPPPYVEPADQSIELSELEMSTEEPEIDFNLGTDFSIDELMAQTTTSRKKITKE